MCYAATPHGAIANGLACVTTLQTASSSLFTSHSQPGGLVDKEAKMFAIDAEEFERRMV
jgi:hypothetical protein